MNFEKDWWILRENANSTALPRKKLSLTYKFAATINDKKAQDKFMKGP